MAKRKPKVEKPTFECVKCGSHTFSFFLTQPRDVTCMGCDAQYDYTSDSGFTLKEEVVA